MPKLLVDRCGPDCIREFRLAARLRFEEGVTLAGDRRTAAIYLWGYAAEMTLKAAYFNFLQFAPDQAIQWRDISTAINVTGPQQCGITWPSGGKGHNVACWAELLVKDRARHAGKAYSPRFAAAVIQAGLDVYLRWRETLRYHKNQAYAHEAATVRRAVEWLLGHSDQL